MSVQAHAFFNARNTHQYHLINYDINLSQSIYNALRPPRSPRLPHPVEDGEVGLKVKYRCPVEGVDVVYPYLALDMIDLLDPTCGQGDRVGPVFCARVVARLES